MCGISGIINKNNVKVLKEEIKNINDLIIHRGPDDEGYYFGNNFAFGHRRLSVVDLSIAGHQPMRYEGKNGEYIITYNGEIYNYIELKEELKNEGYNFVSDTDTEVILASYDRWGSDCVNKFNGMWAFAIYDKKKNIIFCSRDRFGIKPFYYTEVNDKFVFGSEIKQLLYFFDKRYVNKKILLDYLVFGLIDHTNETFFKNIYKLQAGHNLIYYLEKNNYEMSKYYEIPFCEYEKNLKEDVVLKKGEDVLTNAIKLRLRSDVKVGSCLSGGLDSSSIVSIASKLYSFNNKFSAIHAQSLEEKTDESKFAKEVARHCNLDFYIVKPSLEDIKNLMEEVVFTQEEPFGSLSVFMQYFVFDKAKQIGCKVMLDGQGGDEVFFGYESYYIIYFAELIKNLEFFKLLKEYKNLITFKLKKQNIIKHSILAFIRKRLWFVEKIYKKKKFKLKLSLQTDNIFDFKSLKDFQRLQIEKYNLQALLRYEDKNSMRHSVESRVPFVDFNVVEYGINLSNELKFKNGYLKYVLRRLVENKLPYDIIWRKNKFGFEAPEDIWIKEYKEFMLENIQQSNILMNIMDLKDIDKFEKNVLWRLFNISVWEKVYNVKLKGDD